MFGELVNSRLAVAKAERDRCDWSGWESTVVELCHLDATAVEQAPPPFLLNLFPVPMAEVFQEISGYAKAELAKLGEVAREKKVEVVEQVVRILQPHGQSNGALGDPGRFERRGGGQQALVGPWRRRRRRRA